MSDAGAAPGESARLVVVVDVSPLRDGRRQAGIGRYTTAMLAALAQRDDLRLRTVSPPMRPLHDSWVIRWLNAQPAIALARLGGGALLHGMASEVSVAWPASRHVVTVHDVVPWTLESPGRLTRLHLAIQARLLRRCAAVIAVSQTVAGEAIDRLGLEHTRVHVVPEGVNPVFSAVPRGGDEDARRRVGVSAGDYLLWVGSLRRRDPRKAIDLLLEAAAAATGTTLVLTGAAGDESRRLTERAADLGVRLVLPGYVSDQDLAALYRGAAAVVLPSQHEGFGLPVLEAMACGAPIVATRTGNLATLAGEAAMLVPVGDARALAEAIDRLRRDPVARARLAAAGPAVAARYTWEQAAEMTVAVYRAVQERTRATSTAAR